MSLRLWTASIATAPRRIALVAAGLCVAALIGLAHNHSRDVDGGSSSVSFSTGFFPSSWTGGGSEAKLGQGEPVVFSLIVWGNDTAWETEILMKTALMYTSSPIDFHLIADPKSQEFLTDVLNLIERPAHPIRAFFYPLSYEAMKARLARTAHATEDLPRYGELGTKHAASTAGLMKLLIHEILPDTVKRAIFVDSDAFFITDPTYLWREFNTWDPEVMLALPKHPNRGGVYDGTARICSCVYLMHLENMRKHRYIDSSHFSASDRARSLSANANKAVWGEPTTENGVYSNIGLGDQTFFWSIMEFRPDLHVGLPLSWEVTSCLMGWYGTGMHNSARLTAQEQIAQQQWLDQTGYQDTLITPGLLHFNCMYSRTYMASQFFDDATTDAHKKWLHAVRYHQHYKWIWLNRGMKGDQARLTISTATDLRFWDERMGRVAVAAGY